MSKRKDKQRLIRAWKDETGEIAINMHKVAAWAIGKGWPLPVPQSPLDILAKQFADAGREEIEYDKATRRPHRVYHAVQVRVGEQLVFVYYDIHDATRNVMLKSTVNRREQMISDGVQLTLDLQYWNSIHPKEPPIALPMDLQPDIEWRLNTPDEGEEEVA